MEMKLYYGIILTTQRVKCFLFTITYDTSFITFKIHVYKLLLRELFLARWYDSFASVDHRSKKTVTAKWLSCFVSSYFGEMAGKIPGRIWSLFQIALKNWTTQLRQSPAYSSENIYPECSIPTKAFLYAREYYFLHLLNSTVWKTNTKCLEPTVWSAVARL